MKLKSHSHCTAHLQLPEVLKVTYFPVLRVIHTETYNYNGKKSLSIETGGSLKPITITEKKSDIVIGLSVNDPLI